MTAVDLGLDVHHTSLSVADLDAQRAWYQRALGLHEVVEEFHWTSRPCVPSCCGPAPACAWNSSNGPARPGTGPMPIHCTRRSTLGFGHWAVVGPRSGRGVRLPSWRPAASRCGPRPDAVQPGARFAYVKDPEGKPHRTDPATGTVSTAIL